MSIAQVQSFPPDRNMEEGYLPESDGRPMAETEIHRDQMIYLLNALQEYFRNDPKAYVTGNIFLYYRNALGELKSVAPDVFVVKGVKKDLRRVYVLEKEGKAPDVVIELISLETRLEDLGSKRVLYAGFGVAEYFIFDPLQETLSMQLRGFRLEGEEYTPMLGARLHSDVLDLDLVVENQRLRLYDRKTNEFLRSHQEAEVELRLAEAEVARLREELSKLKGGQD
jgi:Uma2 family endonuclease